jgi:4-hydroxy-tetrahydrodipicolinate synthase
MEYARNEAKAWAKQHYVGLEGTLMPSFTPDLQRLDEESIRHDVDYYVRQRHFSILATIEATTLTPEERREFLRIVCDAARGRIMVSLPVLLDTFRDDLALAQYFEELGGHHLLLGCPAQYCPNDTEEVYETMKAFCAFTNLCVDLYPAGRFDLARFGEGTIPVSLLERLAEIDNVVAVKVGNGNLPTYTAHVFKRLGDRLLVNDPMDYAWGFTVGHCNQQWAGAMAYDHYQTPEDPRLVHMFNLFRAGNMDEAMKIFWSVDPLRQLWGQIMMRYAGAGLYPFVLFKYQQWLVGGNGGMLRQPIHRLLDEDAAAMRSALASCGFKPHDAPIEEFFVGRCAYARGERLRRGALAVSY